ncbi:MAG: DUF1800 domain-containing protein [Acidobacteriota bacterium]
MTDRFSYIYKITVIFTLLALLAPVSAIGVNAQTMQKTSAKYLTEDQKILHVLNRLGFGARPGDVARVKAMGLNKYIEQQLNPFSISDTLAEAKVKNLDILTMSNEEVFAKYPTPKAVLQAVAKENGLTKGDVAQLKAKNKNNADEMNKNDAMTADGKAMMPDEKNAANAAPINDEEKQKLQQQVAEIYKQNDLGRPPQITQQLNASRIMRAVYSERQLQEQMVDFWSNHFNVYADKAAVRWFLPEYDRDVIRPNALGNFKDLLLATAKSPAMLFYLDNFQSVSPNMQANNANRNRQMQNGQLNPQQRERAKERLGLNDTELDARMKQMQQRQNQAKKQTRGINENYARELMELHTLGVDGGYTQKDVQEVARCFTGWTIVDPRGYRRMAASVINGTENKRAMRQAKALGLPEDAESGTFYFNERAHDTGEKIVLGQKINEGGIKDGLKVLDILVNNPATAKFIARKLAVKFVSDNPSDPLITRVADAFHNSKGDIKTTLRALFTDKEFYAPENYRAKIKTPFELVISAIRTVGADTNGGQIQALLAKMGEPLYGYIAPTGYPDMAEDWVNTGALLERMNFAVALASNRIRGTKVNLSQYQAANKQEILNKSIAGLLDNEISPNTKAMLLKQIDQPLIEPKLDDTDEAMMENTSMQTGQGGGKRGLGRQAQLLPPSGDAEVFKVVGLILGSPDFQRQ